MKQFSLWAVTIGLFVGALWLGWSFRAANVSSVDLDLLWLRVPNLELWWALVLAASFGASLAAMVLGFIWFRARLLNRRYRKAIKRLESELHQMRSLPLAAGGRAKKAELPDRVAAGRG